jgi:hypothetical protein
MLPSSRTPEGSSNRCPVCGNKVFIGPSDHGDAPCPCCGHLLWFSQNSLPHSPRPSRRRTSRSVPPPTFVAVAYLVSSVACAGFLSGNGGFSWIVWLGIALVFCHYALPWLAGTAKIFSTGGDYRTVNRIIGWGLLLGPIVGSLCGVVVPSIWELPITPFQGGVIGLATGWFLLAWACATLCCLFVVVPAQIISGEVAEDVRSSWRRFSSGCRRLLRR